MDTRARGAEHGGEGGAVGRVQQSAVMVRRFPAQPGRTACRRKHKQQQPCKQTHEQQHNADLRSSPDGRPLPEILKRPLRTMSSRSVA